MIGGGLIRGERPRSREALGLVVAVGAFVWWLAPGLTRPDPLGTALMVVSGVAWGVYSLRGRGRRTRPAPLPATSSAPFRWRCRSCRLAVPAGIVVRGLIIAVFSGGVTSGLGYSCRIGRSAAHRPVGGDRPVVGADHCRPGRRSSSLPRARSALRHAAGLLSRRHRLCAFDTPTLRRDIGSGGDTYLCAVTARPDPSCLLRADPSARAVPRMVRTNGWSPRPHQLDLLARAEAGASVAADRADRGGQDAGRFFALAGRSARRGRAEAGRAAVRRPHPLRLAAEGACHRHRPQPGESRWARSG